MPSMAEMVEAHLVNVQREIANLNERKVAIDAEIAKLETYLEDGKAELQNSVAPPVATESQSAVQSVKSNLF